MMVNTVADYAARYFVELGGADVLVFTAGIGENAAGVRADIIEKLAPLGIKLDIGANKTRGEIKKISADSSSVEVYVIPTNEELMIAEETLRLITR